MFTGIVTAIGVVEKVECFDGDQRITLCAPNYFESINTGDSVAVNGCCLTATTQHADRFEAWVSKETLRCTNLQDLQPGTPVNLEKAATLQQALGGHWVSGHVDGLAVLEARLAEGQSDALTFRPPKTLMRYIAAKGSITLDGVSLTVNTVEEETFTVNVVPHTQQKTTFHLRAVGERLNCEIDMLARYVERLMTVKAEEVRT